MDKSKIFIAYNKAKVSHKLDRARANRALGIVQKGRWLELTDEAHTFVMQSSDGKATYHVNGTCDCKDFQFRTHWCKHRIARAIVLYSRQI